MRRSILLSIALLAMLPATALAQVGYDSLDTWIDTDFDGLPANTPQNLSVGVPDSFDIWVDLTGFPAATWTNFLYSFSLGPGPDSTTNFFARDTGSVVVNYNAEGMPGITFFAENNFDSDFIIQIGGFGAAQNVVEGPFKLATVTVLPIRNGLPFDACITPRIATDNPSYLESSFVSASSDYGTFYNGSRTAGCYTITGGNATNATSWGRLKALYQ
jgi:hypothetical protein